MTIVRYGWSILDRNSPHPELMQRMMQRMAVNAVTAMRIDGGMAWSEARTKCIFCRHEEECRHWLDGSEVPGEPPDFCPIVEFFGWCAETDEHDALLCLGWLQRRGRASVLRLPGSDA